MTGDMFVQHHRDQKLQQYSGSLERMAELVDFGKVAAAVDAACPRPDRSKGAARRTRLRGCESLDNS